MIRKRDNRGTDSKDHSGMDLTMSVRGTVSHIVHAPLHNVFREYGAHNSFLFEGIDILDNTSL